MKLIETIKSVLTNPEEFYASMPSSLGEAAKYAAIMYAVSGVLTALIAGATIGFDVTGLLSLIVIMPILGVLGLFLGGLIIHVFVKLLGGTKGWESTVSVLGYGLTSSALFGWVPAVGFLGTLYSIYLNVVGISRVHGISKLKAFIALLLPGLILGLIAVGVLLLFGAALLSMIDFTGLDGLNTL